MHKNRMANFKKRYLLSSKKGSSDPLNGVLDQHPKLHIISTNGIKLTQPMRNWMESNRPNHIDLKREKPKNLAIIVPYRDRKEHLAIFLEHMHRYLKKQKLVFQIYVVEQPPSQPFNRGLLLNIGAHAAKEEGHDFLCFHDVDLLPIDVAYDKLPNHPYRPFSHFKPQDNAYQAISEHNTFKELYFGGITCFPTDAFFAIGGYGHAYWFWGCEDDDLLIRCLQHGLTPTLHKNHCIENLPHTHATAPTNIHLLDKIRTSLIKQSVNINRKRFRKMQRDLDVHTQDLNQIIPNDYTILQQEGYLHVQAHTQRLIALSKHYPKMRYRCIEQLSLS